MTAEGTFEQGVRQSLDEFLLRLFLFLGIVLVITLLGNWLIWRVSIWLAQRLGATPGRGMLGGLLVSTTLTLLYLLLILSPFAG